MLKDKIFCTDPYFIIYKQTLQNKKLVTINDLGDHNSTFNLPIGEDRASIKVV